MALGDFWFSVYKVQKTVMEHLQVKSQESLRVGAGKGGVVGLSCCNYSRSKRERETSSPVRERARSLFYFFFFSGNTGAGRRCCIFPGLPPHHLLAPSFGKELPATRPLPFFCPSSPVARLSGAHSRTHGLRHRGALPALPWARSAPRCVPAPLSPGLPAGGAEHLPLRSAGAAAPRDSGHGLGAAVEPANAVGPPKPPEICQGGAGGRRRRRGAASLCLGITGAGTERFSSPTPSGCARGLGCPGDRRRAVIPSSEKRHPRNPAG